MKYSRKTLTALSFTLGATLFLSTAFADSLIGSGYDKLKGSVKTTASQMETSLGNYTMEVMYSLKDNGQTFMEVSQRTKFDNAAQATEHTSVTQYAQGEPVQDYSYSDKNRYVWKGSGEDTYYVTEYAQPLKERERPFQDPFKEEGAAELEKIFDAMVGNLKDYVQAESRTDGGITYSASLSETQVPALVNAVASFGVKQIFADEGRSNLEINVPQMASDVYVRKVTGLASQQKGGLLENMTGEVILSGKDKNGSVHDLSLTLTMRMTGVGETKIALPDLTNAIVSREEAAHGFSAKYVGKYKNDIVLEKNGQFVKAGERLLEITRVEENHFAGTYAETVIPGFETDIGEPISFTFNETIDQEKDLAFTYTKANGETGTFQLFPNVLGSVYLSIDPDNSVDTKSMELFNGEFSRIFE